MADDQVIDLPDVDESRRTESGIYIPPPQDVGYPIGQIIFGPGLVMNFVAEDDDAIKVVAHELARLQDEDRAGRDIYGLTLREPAYGHPVHLTPNGVREAKFTCTAYMDKVDPLTRAKQLADAQKAAMLRGGVPLPGNRHHGKLN
jgi:hypothetical protein